MLSDRRRVRLPGVRDVATAKTEDVPFISRSRCVDDISVRVPSAETGGQTGPWATPTRGVRGPGDRERRGRRRSVSLELVQRRVDAAGHLPDERALDIETQHVDRRLADAFAAGLGRVDAESPLFALGCTERTDER